MPQSASVAVIGVGVVGARVARQLTSSGIPVLLYDERSDVRHALALSLRALELNDLTKLDPTTTPVVVVATSSAQAPLVKILLELGHHVVCTSDDVEDTRELLELDEIARQENRVLVVGAAACPGLSGLLVAELAPRVDTIDEIHVAFHGTGGPGCARQHHRALAGDAVGWHDGEWIDRPGGSGRELLWFPEPLGGKDCYRAELPEPLLLHRSFPEVSRISARMSATRRDRLTARLPMMSPPHAEGGVGGVRVEIRGSLNGERCTEVAGVAERTGIIAGAVAASSAMALLNNADSISGVVTLGDGRLNDRALLDDVIRRGITVFEYIGSGA
jgi:hypothetical protein